MTKFKVAVAISLMVSPSAAFACEFTSPPIIFIDNNGMATARWSANSSSFQRSSGKALATIRVRASYRMTNGTVGETTAMYTGRTTKSEDDGDSIYFEVTVPNNWYNAAFGQAIGEDETRWTDITCF